MQSQSEISFAMFWTGSLPDLLGPRNDRRGRGDWKVRSVAFREQLRASTSSPQRHRDA